MKKNVNIYDIDFMHNHGGVNFLAMKVASYHKQLGDNVKLLPTPKSYTKADITYYFKTDQSLPNPPILQLLDDSSCVYGIKNFTNWEPSIAVLACRADYQLYPKTTAWERADVVQIGDEKGHVLPVVQDWKNIETDKDCIIIDKNLWLIPKDELYEQLMALRTRKNIYFLYPISLSAVIDDSNLIDVLMRLSLSTSRRIEWSNSLPFSGDAIEKLISFFKLFKEHHPTVATGNISFQPYTHNGEQPLVDIMNCMTIMEANKTYSFTIGIDKLETRLNSAFMHYYQLMHDWSLPVNRGKSFMELIASYGRPYADWLVYYTDATQWDNEMFRAGIMWIHTFLAHGGDRRWLLHEENSQYQNVGNFPWNEFGDRITWF